MNLITKHYKEEADRLRRWNSALALVATVLAVALIVLIMMTRSDMADLARYHEQYGGLRPAPSIYEEHVTV